MKKKINLILKNLKHILLKLLSSNSKINNISGIYSGKVLILGDGISSVHYRNFIKNYDYIINCNLNISFKPVNKNQVIYWYVGEPTWLTTQLFIKSKNSLNKEMLRYVQKKFPKIKWILHPLGRFFNFFWKDIKLDKIYFSPYSKILLDKNKSYNDFTASFQSCLGIALLSGFKEIHCCGFDGWLLKPKNAIRWYSGVKDSKIFDYHKAGKMPIFLKKALQIAKIKVVSYSHYRSRYSSIKEIKLKNIKKYNPSKDRSKFMDKKILEIWKKWENYRHPNGYSAHIDI